MDSNIKQLIENNIELIDKCDFESLYFHCTTLDEINNLTKMLLSANIDPLPYMKRIHPFMYAKCDDLERVIIPDCITEIHPRAFNKCKNLTKVVIPESVVSISDSAFYGCSNLYQVIYKGTFNQLLDLKLGHALFEDTPLEIIHCSDMSVDITEIRGFK